MSYVTDKVEDEQEQGTDNILKGIDSENNFSINNEVKSARSDLKKQ